MSQRLFSLQTVFFLYYFSTCFERAILDFITGLNHSVVQVNEHFDASYNTILQVSHRLLLWKLFHTFILIGCIYRHLTTVTNKFLNCARSKVKDLSCKCVHLFKILLCALTELNFLCRFYIVGNIISNSCDSFWDVFSKQVHTLSKIFGHLNIFSIRFC